MLGLARSGVALARFLADAGARVTVYDGRPAGELGAAIARSADGTVDPAARAGRGSGRARGRTRPWSRRRRRSPPTTRRPSRVSGRRCAALVAARAAGDPSVPALVSESDLFLRLCPAPTIGVTGTKGKTTTSSLAHAILAADPIHPAILGGNIGTPLVERLPELTPEHRVVVELSGAPAAGALARHHGRRLHQRHLGPPRPPRLARRLPAGQAPPRRARGPRRGAGAQPRGPGRRRVRGPGHRAGGPVPGRPPRARRARRRWTAGSWRRPWSACRSPAVAWPAGPGGGIMPVDELAIPGAPQRRPTRWPPSRSGCCSASPPTRSAAPRRPSRASSTGSSRWPGRRGPVRQRLAGHPAGRGHRRAACLPRSGRADRRRPGQGTTTCRAGAGGRADRHRAVLIGESGPTLERLFRAAAWPGRAAATMDEAVDWSAIAGATRWRPLPGPPPARRRPPCC